MTDHHTAEATPRALTTSQSLARYDTKMRAAADVAGVPTNRTTGAGLVLSGDLDSVIYTGIDAQVYVVSMREETAPVRLTFPLLRSLLVDAYDLGDPDVQQHNTFVFADTDTMNRVANKAETWGRGRHTQEARSTSRLLAFRKTLPFSTYTPVLTEALASRYWLPGTGAVDDLAAWDEAFAHGKTFASREAFSYLIDRALDGDHDTKIMTVIRSAEKYAVRAAQYGSDHAACSAFTRAGTVTDAYAAMLSLDPTLRERNMLSGVVSKVRIHQIRANSIEAYIDDVGKIREGSKVLIFDGRAYERKVEVALKSIEFVNGALMAVLSTPSRDAPNRHILEQAKANHAPLYVAPAPFLMVKKGPKNRRWTSNDNVDKTLRVDIPLDIALARDPVEG